MKLTSFNLCRKLGDIDQNILEFKKDWEGSHLNHGEFMAHEIC